MRITRHRERGVWTLVQQLLLVRFESKIGVFVKRLWGASSSPGNHIAINFITASRP
jgi:hypothetical protein